MPVCLKNFFASMFYLTYAKGQLKLIFIPDNALYHKAKTVLSFLEEEAITVMKKSPQSPDMNSLENVWKIVGAKAQNRNPQNIDDF